MSALRRLLERDIQLIWRTQIAMSCAVVTGQATVVAALFNRVCKQWPAYQRVS